METIHERLCYGKIFVDSIYSIESSMDLNENQSFVDETEHLSRHTLNEFEYPQATDWYAWFAFNIHIGEP